MGTNASRFRQPSSRSDLASNIPTKHRPFENLFILDSQVNAHIKGLEQTVWLENNLNVQGWHPFKIHPEISHSPWNNEGWKKILSFLGFSLFFKGKHVIVLGKVIHHIAISKSPKRVGVLLVSVQSTSHPRGPFFDWTDLHGWSLPKQPQTKYIKNLLRSSTTITTNYHIPSSYISFMS